MPRRVVCLTAVCTRECKERHSVTAVASGCARGNTMSNSSSYSPSKHQKMAPGSPQTSLRPHTPASSSISRLLATLLHFLLPECGPPAGYTLVECRPDRLLPHVLPPSAGPSKQPSVWDRVRKPAAAATATAAGGFIIVQC